MGRVIGGIIAALVILIAAARADLPVEPCKQIVLKQTILKPKLKHNGYIPVPTEGVLYTFHGINSDGTCKVHTSTVDAKDIKRIHVWCDVEGEKDAGRRF